MLFLEVKEVNWNGCCLWKPLGIKNSWIWVAGKCTIVFKQFYKLVKIYNNRTPQRNLLTFNKTFNIYFALFSWDISWDVWDIREFYSYADFLVYNHCSIILLRTAKTVIFNWTGTAPYNFLKMSFDKYQ